MSKPVLFVTGLGKEIRRAENLTALYDSYEDEKYFISMKDENYQRETESGKYGLLVTDIFPIKHPMKTIMIWHAIQGCKYIGLDEKNTYYRMSYAKNIDAIVVAGHGGIEMFNRCTAVPKERIYNLGMPRTDRYIGKKKGDGGTFLANKRAYLYVPTFRTRSETALPEINWAWLDHQLTDEEVIVIKSHPVEKDQKVTGYKHIIEVGKMMPTVNYLYDCDVVITDYSSVMFDAYLLKRPVVLFEKNPGYTETRGMYLKYPDAYCSRYATNEEELLMHLREARSLNDQEIKCLNYVADSCDGHSCERIIKLINEMKGD